MEYISTNVIIGLLALFSVILLCLVGLLASYIFVLKSTNQKKLPLPSEEKLIAEAHTKSLKILEDARKKAKEILSESRNFTDRSEKAINKELEKVTKSYAEIYESSISSIRLEAASLIDKIPNQLGDSMEQILGDYETILRKATEGAAQNIEKSSKEIAVDYKNQLDEIKKKKIEEINSKLPLIVRNIIEEVMGRTISDTEHEKLVMVAIEEAKKEGVFDILVGK